MININNTKTIPQSIDRLNDAVLGVDPETKVLSRLYEGDEPLQDRVNALEDGQTNLQDRVSTLEDGQTGLEEATIQLEQQIEAIDVTSLEETAVRLEQLIEALDRFTLTNLVENGDLTIPSSNPVIPQGFDYSGTSTNRSLNNGVVKFTPSSQYASFAKPNSSGAVIGNTYYTFAWVKSDSAYTYMSTYSPTTHIFHTGSGTFEYLSSISTKTGTDNRIDVITSLTSDWTPIEVDYIGAINLTETFGAGNEPTKEALDAMIQLYGYKENYTLNLKDIFGILSRIQ